LSDGGRCRTCYKRHQPQIRPHHSPDQGGRFGGIQPQTLCAQMQPPQMEEAATPASERVTMSLQKEFSALADHERAEIAARSRRALLNGLEPKIPKSRAAVDRSRALLAPSKRAIGALAKLAGDPLQVQKGRTQRDMLACSRPDSERRWNRSRPFGQRSHSEPALEVLPRL